MIRIDTTNILFICGGAFDGLVPIIENRIGKKVLGFGAEVQSQRDPARTDALKDVRPEDLTKYGLIPEFVGRLPILVTLDGLDEDALVRILTEPKNALCKQYEALLDMDGVKLTFEVTRSGRSRSRRLPANAAPADFAPSSRTPCWIPCSNCPDRRRSTSA